MPVDVRGLLQLLFVWTLAYAAFVMLRRRACVRRFSAVFNLEVTAFSVSAHT
jgi:hypothetical protein